MYWIIYIVAEGTDWEYREVTGPYESLSEAAEANKMYCGTIVRDVPQP